MMTLIAGQCAGRTVSSECSHVGMEKEMEGEEAVTDRDGDGTADTSDACPLDPEDMDGFEDHDGCPDPDNDSDGIKDPDDVCPDEPETPNGMDDEDGCPEPPDLVKITCQPGEPYEQLYYEPGDPIFKKDWKPLLDSLAEVIMTNPVLRVEIAAHSDKKGSSKKNIAMTRKRAEAVVEYLEKKGVGKGILSAAGYGPVCCCMSPKASKNRRIEFILLETESGCGSSWPICQEAADLGLVPDEDLKYLPDSDYCK
jgi:outer membrane protein OmpA-like peptidoglycan-associated protein